MLNRVTLIRVILATILTIVAAAVSHRANAVGTVGLRATLPAGTTVINLFHGLGNSVPPYSVVVTSSTCVNTFSFDGGVTYFAITAAYTVAGQNVYFMNNPFTQLKMTGCTAGDQYQIL